MRDGVAMAVAVPAGDTRAASEEIEVTATLLADDAEVPRPPGGGSDLMGTIHSFLFGDHIALASSAAHWRTVGRFIIEKRGTMSVKELYPYLLNPPSLGLSAPPRVVACILAHFRGTSLADGTGALRCSFPELLTPEATMALEEPPQGYPQGPGQGPASRVGSSSSFLVEEPRAFSQRPPEQLQLALLLGVINLLGCFWLRSALANGVVPRGPLTPAVSWVSRFLLAYAWAYLLLPCGRLALVYVLNAATERRNATRRAMAEELAQRRE